MHDLRACHAGHADGDVRTVRADLRAGFADGGAAEAGGVAWRGGLKVTNDAVPFSELRFTADVCDVS